ncbi:uncharacterized protein DS421_16g552180 [Arachis hypogaea]|nr:uncharacterized protein DS421_16g552180 [Arachis hypogaea]
MLRVKSCPSSTRPRASTPMVFEDQAAKVVVQKLREEREEKGRLVISEVILNEWINGCLKQNPAKVVTYQPIYEGIKGLADCEGYYEANSENTATWVASLGSVFSSPRSEEPCIGLQSGSGLVDMDQDPRTIREQQVSLERDVLVSPEGENGVGDPHGALSWLDGGQERLRRGSEGPMSASRSSSSAPLTMPRNDGEEVNGTVDGRGNLADIKNGTGMEIVTTYQGQ